MIAADPSGAVADRVPDSAFEQQATLRAVTILMGAVVGLTFLFGFGNVWSLALRLGVSVWVAPLIAPAVDLSVMALLLGTRYIALRGGSPEHVRPARRLLALSSVLTLALNVTDPLITGHLGKAAFDAVGPLLLIGWAEVGPGLLHAISAVAVGREDTSSPPRGVQAHANGELPARESVVRAQGREEPDDLLERARGADARHRELYQRPISAESLRKQLRVGAARSRTLVARLRSEPHEHGRGDHGDPRRGSTDDTAVAARRRDESG